MLVEHLQLFRVQFRHLSGDGVGQRRWRGFQSIGDGILNVIMLEAVDQQHMAVQLRTACAHDGNGFF